MNIYFLRILYFLNECIEFTLQMRLLLSINFKSKELFLKIMSHTHVTLKLNTLM